MKMIDLFLVELHSVVFEHIMDTEKVILLVYTVNAQEAFVLAPM